MNAICIGKCTLDPNIRDPDQPPIPLLGRPVRQMMYGFAMPLMSASHRRCITEYHRNEKVDEAENPWGYMPLQVQPRKYTVKNGVLRYTFAMVFWDTFIYVGVT